MDNAMVKRGIGAVVLAIIAALLLGFLLKDKSSARQEIVDMKLPGAPEVSIPSLSDATAKVTDSAATLVDEAKDKVNDAGNAVIASATGTASSLTDGASNVVEAVTDSVSSTAKKAVEVVENKTVASSSNNSNASDPGFSIRPPTKNEEQEINTSSSTTTINDTSTSTTEETTVSDNTVVASTKKEEKVFKPVIENEPKKPAKKVVKKKPAPKKTVAKKPAAPKPSTSKSSKYAIQLLATSSQSRANKLAKTMNSEGYVSFITQTKSNNKVLYRVRVGGHKDRNAALSAQQSMKRRYQKNFFVQNSLVVSQ